MIIITKEPKPFRRFNCNRCDTSFFATKNDFYSTKTGYGASCPNCGYATYSPKTGLTFTLEEIVKYYAN